MSPGPPLTTDQYLRTPETLLPQELIFGMVREAAAAPTPGHQAFVGSFYLALSEHVRAHRLGRVWVSPIDVVLDDRQGLVLQPDLLFVSEERSRIVTDRVWGAPDMVLEVLSPEPRLGRLEERVTWFGRYGAQECWLIHQRERKVAIVRFEEGAVRERTLFDEQTPIRSRLFPDFGRSLADILG
jgi:Uma2 family endonuclease